MEALKEFWIFSQKDRQSLLVSQLSLGAVLVMLLILMQIPRWVVSSSFDEAELAIANAAEVIEEAEARYEREASWFVPSYTENLSDQLALAQRYLNEDNVSGAEVLLQEAQEGNYDQAHNLAQDAISQAKVAQEIAVQVVMVLDTNASLRNTAQSQLNAVVREKSAANTQFSVVERRFSAEEGNYLLKYTEELTQRMETANERLEKASQHLDTARGLLPDAADRSWSGDPLLALDNIEQATIEITEQNTLTAYVTSRLDLLAEAERNAASTIAQAGNSIESVMEYFAELELSRGYDPDRALSVAYTQLGDALAKYETASIVVGLEVQPEGKIDYLFAYQTAQDSVGAAATARQTAQAVVAADDASLAKLSTFESRMRTAESAIYSAESAETTLRSYHANSTWSGVANNISQAESKLSSAQRLRTDAQSARRLQDFVAAEQKIDQALQELTSIEQLCSAVVSRKDALESARSQWSSAKSDAESAISRAASAIATNHTDASTWSARSLLSDAEAAARSQRYEDAVSLANQAEDRAEDARSEAIADEAAYQDQLRRDAQATRDAEAAATRASETATRNAESASSSSSGSGSIDFDSGDSSGGSSSGGSSSGDSGSIGGGSGDSGSIGGNDSGDSCAFGCD